MLNNLQQLDTIDFRGHIFIGIVRFNNDPLRLERIKVSIPGVFDSPNEAELPWVAPLAEGPIPNGSGFGSFGLVPPVGSKVFVQFQHGNPLYPVYYGSPIVQGDRVAEANVNYPNRYGWRDPRGNVFYVDTTEGGNVIRLEHASGTTVTINNDGRVTVQSVEEVQVISEGNMLLQSNADLRIQATGRIDLESGGDTVLVTGGIFHANPD